MNEHLLQGECPDASGLWPKCLGPSIFFSLISRSAWHTVGARRRLLNKHMTVPLGPPGPQALPSPIPGLAVQIVGKTAWGEGANASSWCLSGSDDNQTAGRGSCSLAVGTAPLGEAAGAHQRLRVARCPGPSDGCCLLGCEPEKQSSPRDAAALRPGCQRQEEAAPISRSENKGTADQEASTRSQSSHRK